MSLKFQKQEYVAIWLEEMFGIWLLSVLATDCVKVTSISFLWLKTDSLVLLIPSLRSELIENTVSWLLYHCVICEWAIA
jgi:hypothetical protein